MLAKVIILITMLLILVALGFGLFYLVRDEGKTKRTVRALSFRIGISLTLFIFLFLAFHFSLISPHGLTQ